MWNFDINNSHSDTDTVKRSPLKATNSTRDTTQYAQTVGYLLTRT